MVRPERRVVLTGASPVRVSAGAPGSRLQPGGEIRPNRAECRKPLKEREANQRAATISERDSLVKFSADSQPKGVGEGRADHFTAKATDSILETGADAGPLRGRRRWHVGKEQGGTGETLPGSRVGQRPGV